MRDFDFINTFFNIVYQNELAYLRDLTSSCEYVLAFSSWLKKRHIDMPSLLSLQQENMKMISSCQKIIDIDHILHITLSQEIENIVQHYQDKTHILYIPGFDEKTIIDCPCLEYKGVYFYNNKQIFSKDDLSFFDPFSKFFVAMEHVDLWPGFLIFNQNNHIFIPMSQCENLENLFACIDKGEDLFNIYPSTKDDSYFVQLSDLHLGKGKNQKGLAQLYNSLDEIVPYLHSQYPLKILITGDLMESPNRKNMYLANDFMNNLKKIYKANVTFVLGNHDVIVHGFNFARTQKSKVIAYLLGESVKVLEQEKVIIVKMDTTSEGNLARGKVGLRQLEEIDDELEAIDCLEDYTMLVMLHHHVYPISKAQFIKTKWHEKTFINKIVETSKVLVDATLLINWLEEKNIRYIFHGHKHLPFFKKESEKYYVAAGSATGGLKENKSRYISYNVMKYHLKEKQMKVCMIIYDDKAKAERRRVEVYLFGEDEV